MSLPDWLAWSVALRSLRGSTRLTAMTMVVVCVSVVLVVFLSSLIEGLRVSLVEQTTSAIAHVELRPRARRPASPASMWTPTQAFIGRRAPGVRREATLQDWNRWARYASTFEEVEAVSPTAAGQGLAARGAREEAVRIIGVDPRRYEAIAQIQKNLLQGRFLALGPGEVVMGRALAETLGVTLGGRVRLTTGRGVIASKRVAGIYETGLGVLDEKTVLLTLGDGQSLFGLGASVTSIGLKIRDVFGAPALAARMQRQVPHDVRDWTQDNQRLLDALTAQKRSSDMVTAFTAIAAAFAVASILIVLVTNKLREIGILKAMGATQRQIRHIFAIQGVILASGGALIGCALGAGLVEVLSGVQTTSASGQLKPLFPFALRWELLVGTVLVSALLGFFASLVPARRAAKVDPIEVIRG